MAEKLVNFDEIRNNNYKSFLLFVIFFCLVAGLGYLLGWIWGSPITGLVMAFLFGIIYSIIAWFAGADMLLSLSQAKPVTKREYPYLFHTIEGLSLAAGIPVPKAYVIEDSAMNAFATGRDPDNSAVVVTTGLLKSMNREELEGVLAHEMSHIKNYDIRTMLFAAVLTGVMILLSDILLRSFLYGKRDREGGNATMILILIGIVFAVLAPLIGELIKLAISRKREYAADASGAVLTRYPQGLANALRKISKDPDPLVDTANKATAHLFISTPFRDRKGWLVSLWSTHPPIEERIRRLEAM